MKNKNRKGFTLIELLAVIVILAIIALIATPIILGIINDARIESNKRSIENYGKSIEQAIARYQLTHNVVPTDISQLNVEYDGARVNCKTTKMSEEGKVYLAGCRVGNSLIDYEYGINPIICTAVTQATSGVYTIGDKYTCTVAKEKKYTFFMVSDTSNEVNLILDSNIDVNGAPIKEDLGDNYYDVAFTPWLTTKDYVSAGGNVENMINCHNFMDLGPVTALKYLTLATSSWRKDISIRLPHNSEIQNKTNAPYLYDNLFSFYSYWTDTGIISGDSFSQANLSDPNEWWYCSGFDENSDVSSEGSGVRPVITVPKSQIG